LTGPRIGNDPANRPPTNDGVPPAAAPAPRPHVQFLHLARRFIIPAANKARGLRLGFDIEADGLLDTAAKIHCIVIINLDIDRIDEYGPKQIDDALAHLSRADYLTGHNIIGYDLSLLRRLRGWTPSPGCAVVDTLIASRLILPHLLDLDIQATAMRDPFLGKLAGSHSLKAWGARLGDGMDPGDARALRRRRAPDQGTLAIPPTGRANASCAVPRAARRDDL
jgi:hypothetical protein